MIQGMLTLGSDYSGQNFAKFRIPHIKMIFRISQNIQYISRFIAHYRKNLFLRGNFKIFFEFCFTLIKNVNMLLRFQLSSWVNCLNYYKIIGILKITRFCNFAIFGQNFAFCEIPKVQNIVHCKLWWSRIFV